MFARWTGDLSVDRASAPDPATEESPNPCSVSGIQNAAPPERAFPVSSSFLELYRTHFNYVWKTARRLGVMPAELDDVVQETFLTAHRRGHSYEAQGSESSWLFGILYHIVLHHRRSHRRRRAAFTEDGMNPDVLPGTYALAPDKSAETRQTVRILEEILDGLDPEKRSVLILAELEEKSSNEIAEILGINVNTATSRLRLAREAVEAAMARHRARDGWRYR